MRSVTAATATPCVILLSMSLGSSSGVRAADNFVLLVNVASGQAAMRSDFPSTVWINQYSIASPGVVGSLTPATWNSLDDQNAGGGAWREDTVTSNLLAESTVFGVASFQNGTGVHLGTIFNPANARNLAFQYRLAGSATTSLGAVSYVMDDELMAGRPKTMARRVQRIWDVASFRASSKTDSTFARLENAMHLLQDWMRCI